MTHARPGFDPQRKPLSDYGTTRTVGLEAGTLTQWLTYGLRAAGFKPVVLEARHVQAALAAMRNKTDRNDARGIAQILRTGWYRPVHVKSIESHFGEGCLTGQPRRLATVTAMSDLELMRFDNAAIQRVLYEEPDFSEFFISYLLARDARVEADLVDQLFNSSEGGKIPSGAYKSEQRHRRGWLQFPIIGLNQ
jgi:Transposase